MFWFGNLHVQGLSFGLQNGSKSLLQTYEDWYNCKLGPPYAIDKTHLYKFKNNLLYPINLARNVARISSLTRYVLASDIELYPTRNFSAKFFEMMANNPRSKSVKPTVYVLPIFEIPDNVKPPETKTELQHLHKNAKAFVFHYKVCKWCHMVPKGNEWLQTSETSGLHEFSVAKRKGIHRMWEPFYVGTNDEPLFDERFTWEGQSNKMVQVKYH